MKLSDSYLKFLSYLTFEFEKLLFVERQVLEQACPKSKAMLGRNSINTCTRIALFRKQRSSDDRISETRTRYTKELRNATRETS